MGSIKKLYSDVWLKIAFLLVTGNMCIVQLNAAGWVHIRMNMNSLMPASLPSGPTGPHLMACSPDKDLVFAWNWQQPPIKSTDGGMTWTRCGQDAGSARIDHGTTVVLFDPNNSSIYWENGMYGGGGLYKTINDGNFYTLFNASSGQCDGLGIDFTDPARKTIVMGGHEAKKTVYKSGDGGLTWNNIGGGLPGIGLSNVVYVVDAYTYLVNEAGYWGGPSNGLHRTTDGGATWSKVRPENLIGYPLHFSNGKLFWMIANSGGLLMSADNGATWTKTSTGGNYTGEWQGALAEMPGNKLVALSTYRTDVITSDNDGKTWTSIAKVPFSIGQSIAGVAYNKARDCLYVWADKGVATARYDFSGVSSTTTVPVRSAVNRQTVFKMSGVLAPSGIKGENLSVRIYDIRGKDIANVNRGKMSNKLDEKYAHNCYVVKVK